MLKDYPIYFDDVNIGFFPSTWEESYTNIENSAETEAGTTLVTIVRKSKLSVSVSCGVTADKAKMFKEFSMKDSFILKKYDTLEQEYQEYNVRMTEFSISLKPSTEKISISNGLWYVSFTLEEF